MRTKFILVFFLVFLGFYRASGQGSDSISNNQAYINSNALYTKDSVLKVDLIDYLTRLFRIEKAEEKRNGRKVYFSLFPSTSNMAGNRTSFSSFSAAFLLGDISNTNVSNIYFYPYIGTNGRYGFQLQPYIWLKRNSWNLTGEYFILNYPQSTWGLGGNSLPEYETQIYYKHARIHQNILREILPNFSVGLGYALDSHFDIDVDQSDSIQNLSDFYSPYISQSVSSGLVLPILFDSRRNSLNPNQGELVSFAIRFYDPLFGSDSRWQSVFFDLRKYLSISSNRNQIIALRSYYWSIISGEVPYLDLPANRWEPINGSATRGIQRNRYRSNAMLYFESEYRFGITANELLGGVFFLNILAPSEFNTQQFLYWHPAAGAGLRFKFNKYSNTNVTLDAGFSKDFWSVYLSIGEAF